MSVDSVTHVRRIFVRPLSQKTFLTASKQFTLAACVFCLCQADKTWLDEHKYPAKNQYRLRTLNKENRFGDRFRIHAAIDM